MFTNDLLKKTRKFNTFSSFFSVIPFLLLTKAFKLKHEFMSSNSIVKLEKDLLAIKLNSFSAIFKFLNKFELLSKFSVINFS